MTAPGHALALRVSDANGVRAVVVEADDTIWIADELWNLALDPGRERMTGDIEVEGELVSFGTPGEGLGKVTYRVVEHNRLRRWRVCERVKPIKCAHQPSYWIPTA